jgi:putative ABC transport system substrate-binding protein
MNKKIFVALLVSLAVSAVSSVQAQPHKPYRIGIIHEGGTYDTVVEGLKDGLRGLGLEPGRDVLLEIRDMQGNRAAVGAAARSLEQTKVDLLCSLSTGDTIAAKAATKEVPIVFVIGTDAAAEGLVESPAHPGGRLTGVQSLSRDLTAKRLEILKEILPTLHRVVTFYHPSTVAALEATKLAREAARKLNIEINERPIASAEEFRRAFNALAPKDADAFVTVGDAMILSQSKFIIDTARSKKLPTMFSDPNLVTQGALAGYGVNRYDQGRLMAKYVQRVLTGTPPRELPVESISTYELGLNLQTARDLGITITQSVLFRADKVIE